jgi:hypothetical protein
VTAAWVTVELCADVDPWISISVAHHVRCQVAAAVRKHHDEVVDVLVTVVPLAAAVDDLDAMHTSAQGSPAAVEAAVRRVVMEDFAADVKLISHLTCHRLPQLHLSTPQYADGFVVVRLTLPPYTQL